MAIIVGVYLIVGSVGFVVHGSEFLSTHAFHCDDALVELTELIAFVCAECSC